MPVLTPEARRHRRDLDELVRLANNDLSLLFRKFTTADAARSGLMDVLPRLASTYGSAAASLGADYFDDMRDLAEVRGRFTAIPAELPDRGRTDSLARWAIEPLFKPKPDFETTLTKVGGGLQRIIANADRQTIRVSSVQDKRAGWVRVGSGECDWCDRYLDGEVHYTEGYDFDAHDWCKCSADPVFD